MKIRTQFILTLLFFGLLLTGMVASLIATDQQVDQLRQQEEIARRVEQGADELNYLSGDYLMYGESQQRARWEARFASFSADLAKLKPVNIEQQAIVSHMISDQKRLRALFTDVVSALEKSAQTSGGAPDPAFNQVSWSRTEVQNQSIAFAASRLSQQLREEAERLRQLNFALIFILIGIFGAYLLSNYYLIDRRTLRSIAQLQAGTEIIGSGDLDFTIAVKRMDEIGELSVAFNRMTANLKEVTASKADLEREIAERKQVEEALRQSEERFRLALTHAPVSVAAQNLDLRYIWGRNQRTRGAEEIVGKTDIDLFPLQAEHLTELKRRVLETGENAREQLWVTSNDQELFLDLFIEPLRNEAGEIEGVGLATVDLTQVKLAEEALQEVNEKLQEQAREMELQSQELKEQKNELVAANEQLRLSEELANQRRIEIESANKELQIARLAALNLMEDALSAKEKLQQINLRLHESEQRLNRAQEIAHLGSWELDLKNNQLSWSDEVYRIFGLQPQEFGATYEAFLEAVHPDDRAAVDAAYSGSTRDGRDQYEIEHRVLRRSSGEIRIVHEKCEHFRNEAGQITRSIGMVHDITERKRVEEALRRAHDELELRVVERTKELAAANVDLVREIAERKEIERQLRIQTTAMETAANGIVITDHQGNIQWTNPALTQISGYDTQNLIGQSTRIFRSGQHDAAYYRQMWDTILSGQVWRGETINQRKDRTLYIEEQTITPVHDENNQIAHFIAIKQDITLRKQAERELEKRNEELRILSEAERYQRQFAEALVEATLIVNKSLKLSEVLSLILEQIRGVIPYQLGNISLLEGDSFYDACHHGDLPWPASLMGMNNRFHLESFPLLTEMRQSGKPIHILDSQKQPNWVHIEDMAWVRSLLSAPILAEQNVIGFVTLFSNQPEFFTAEMRNRLVAFAAHAAAAIQNAWLFEQVQASTERLQSLSRRLVEIQENERRYISRELHDEAGQVLTSLLVDLRLLEKNISEPKILQKIVTEMEGSLNGVIENLHRIAMALRPASLDHVGLVSALRQHTESIAEKHGLDISFTASGVVERLPANIETVLYRIVQEALTNIVRHAHATRVDVVLTVRDGKLIVIIEDDGMGFDPEVASTGNHLGLFGMRERTEMIDGKLMIESAPGRGTTIMMEVGYADTIGNRG